MNSPASCPACNATENRFRESAAAYRILDCAQCGLSFSDPMRAGDEAYYQDHVVYERASEGVAAQQLVSADNRLNRALLRELPSGARTLDIGCGYGAFVALARRHGFDAYGVDFNSAQIDMGQRAYGLADRLRVGRIEDLAELNLEQGYDLVSLFEVVEHVERPRALLEQARRLLRVGGLLALSCPNEARWQPAGRIFVDYPPHHLTRWSERPLTRFLRELGFRDLRVRLDASFRDILWTAVVNRSAANKDRRTDSHSQEHTPAAGRSWKHVLFDAAGVMTMPADVLLRAFGIGTMGMRVLARRGAEGGGG